MQKQSEKIVKIGKIILKHGVVGDKEKNGMVGSPDNMIGI